MIGNLALISNTPSQNIFRLQGNSQRRKGKKHTFYLKQDRREDTKGAELVKNLRRN